MNALVYIVFKDKLRPFFLHEALLNNSRPFYILYSLGALKTSGLDHTISLLNIYFILFLFEPWQIISRGTPCDMGPLMFMSLYNFLHLRAGRNCVLLVTSAYDTGDRMLLP